MPNISADRGNILTIPAKAVIGRELPFVVP